MKARKSERTVSNLANQEISVNHDDTHRHTRAAHKCNNVLGFNLDIHMYWPVHSDFTKNTQNEGEFQLLRLYVMNSICRIDNGLEANMIQKNIFSETSWEVGADEHDFVVSSQRVTKKSEYS